MIFFSEYLYHLIFSGKLKKHISSPGFDNNNFLFRHIAFIQIFSDCFIKHYNISGKFTKKNKNKNKKVHSPNDTNVCLVKLTYTMKTTIARFCSLSLLKFMFIELKCPKKKKSLFLFFQYLGVILTELSS